MLKWPALFLVFAVIAGILGFFWYRCIHSCYNRQNIVCVISGVVRHFTLYRKKTSVIGVIEEV